MALQTPPNKPAVKPVVRQPVGKPGEDMMARKEAARKLPPPISIKPPQNVQRSPYAPKVNPAPVVIKPPANVQRSPYAPLVKAPLIPKSIQTGPYSPVKPNATLPPVTRGFPPQGGSSGGKLTSLVDPNFSFSRSGGVSTAPNLREDKDRSETGNASRAAYAQMLANRQSGNSASGFLTEAQFTNMLAGHLQSGNIFKLQALYIAEKDPARKETIRQYLEFTQNNKDSNSYTGSGETQTQVGNAATDNSIALANTTAGHQTAAAAAQQEYAMAQIAANNAAQLEIAKLQYSARDENEYNQMLEMYEALQQQMMALQNTYIQSLIDREKVVPAPVVPAPAPGPTPFVPGSFPPSPQTGAYAEFSDTGLGTLNQMNPQFLQVLDNLMRARGYTGAGSTGRYGERTYARPGGSGALGVRDEDFENPLNYINLPDAERENAEAAMRWFLGQSGFSPVTSFPGMPTYSPTPPDRGFYPMPIISGSV